MKNTDAHNTTFLFEIDFVYMKPTKWMFTGRAVL